MSGQPVATIHQNLLSLKNDVPEALAAIVIAGDPNVNDGVNFCDQPGSCCGGLDCQVFHATRLWNFAGMLAGQNGVTANLCDGAASVPSAVENAFNGDIDLACQNYMPEG
jgi:hypothetical protein